MTVTEGEGEVVIETTDAHLRRRWAKKWKKRSRAFSR